MKIAMTQLPLPKVSLKFSSIFNKEFCVLWFLRNAVSIVDGKSSIYSLIYKSILSKTFEI